MDIAAGSNVSITITATPTGAAACKTLTRICAKDAAVRKSHRWNKRNRPSWQTWRRGGKMWHHQMKSHAPVRLEPGAQYTVRATVDVLRDLQSVERFVKLAVQ
ncbi:MAG: hypothetical protein PVJ57_07515 [Phycisphaerae bacterium]|jgi:hypothetical protein